MLPGSDPEYAGHVLLVGVNDVRLTNAGDFEFGVTHVQDLTNCDTYKKIGSFILPKTTFSRHFYFRFSFSGTVVFYGV